MPDKPYPWTCGDCATPTVEPVVIENHEVQKVIDGQLVTLTIPNFKTQKCTTCDTVWYSTIGESRQIEEAIEKLRCLKQSESSDTAQN